MNHTIRGLMVDPARLTERHEYYFDLLEFMADWGFNTLWWHFADDQGFCLKLDRHPEIATPYAFTKDQTRRLIDKAAKVGIDIVPEVEALGHTKYITRLPQFAHLEDGPEGAIFNSVCPSNPQTLPLLREIIEEVAELFPSPWFHAGLDEVDFSACPRCKKRLRGKPAWSIYCEHTKAIHQIVTGLGKRMILWADHVEADPAMLKVLPKDMVMAHWQYTTIRPDAIARSLAAGFDVICAPSCLHYHDILQPNEANIQNLDDMLVAARRLGKAAASAGRARRKSGASPAPSILGVVNTWWTSWRILRDAETPILAYTGAALSAGKPVDRTDAFGLFLRRRYGLVSKAAADALLSVHRHMLNSRELNACMFDSVLDMHDLLALAADETFQKRQQAITEAAGTLANAAKLTKTNRRELDAIVLAAKLASAVLGQGLRLRKVYDLYRDVAGRWEYGKSRAHVAQQLRATLGELVAMHKAIAPLAKAVGREWDRTRHADDVKKDVTDVTRQSGYDVLTARIARHVAFLTQMIDTLRQSIDAFVAGGPLPGGVQGS